MNRIIIKGRLTRDVELKTTPSGVEVASFSVAVGRNFTAKDGEKQVDFFSVTAWRQTASFIAKYFTKGKEMLIEGEMQSRKYTDKNGIDRVAWEIIAGNVEFCGSKGSDPLDDFSNKLDNANIGEKPRTDIDTAVDDDLPF